MSDVAPAGAREWWGVERVMKSISVGLGVVFDNDPGGGSDEP